MDLLTFAIIGILAVAALVTSTFGFGLGLIAMPCLAVMVDMKTATPLVALVILTVAVTVLLQQWQEVQVQSVWRLMLGSVFGVPLGLFVLKGAHDQAMKLVLAFLIMAFACYNLFTPHLLALKTERASYLFGVVSGMLGGAYTIPGPPIVVYGALRQWTPRTFRVTLLGYFLPSTLVVILGHYAAGLWTPVVLRLFAISLPAVLGSIVLGNYMNRALPPGRFDRVLHVFLLCMGLVLAVQVFKTMVFAS